MNVWIVTFTDWDYTDIKGVYDSEEKAKQNSLEEGYDYEQHEIK